ncbi:MAG TPA: Lrp/AsnC family transcriptional regulator [Planktothrix sp.]
MPDAADEILTILARDARTAPEAIASMVGRPVADVKAAIAEYERTGVIKRYKTILDWEKTSPDKVVAFIDVKVTPARDVGFDAIASRIARFPEVQSVWLVSGGNDLRVMIEAANLRDLGSFVAERLATINGITGTTTHFILRRYKEDHVMFIETEEDQRLVVSP